MSADELMETATCWPGFKLIELPLFGHLTPFAHISSHRLTSFNHFSTRACSWFFTLSLCRNIEFYFVNDYNIHEHTHLFSVEKLSACCGVGVNGSAKIFFDGLLWSNLIFTGLHLVSQRISSHLKSVVRNSDKAYWYRRAEGVWDC